MKQPNQHSLLTHVPIAMVSPQGGASCGANTSALLFSKVVCTLAAVQCFSSQHQLNFGALLRGLQSPPINSTSQLVPMGQLNMGDQRAFNLSTAKARAAHKARFLSGHLGYERPENYP